MTSIEFSASALFDNPADAPDSTGRRTLGVSFARLWHALIRPFEKRRAFVKLSRLSPHVQRDMGVDPETVADALVGSWDEVDLARYLRRRHTAR
jgi:uncharacterized protein YjiS (DUF1127 family)